MKRKGRNVAFNQLQELSVRVVYTSTGMEGRGATEAAGSETAVDESRKETAERVARHQVD